MGRVIYKHCSHEIPTINGQVFVLCVDHRGCRGVVWCSGLVRDEADALARLPRDLEIPKQYLCVGERWIIVVWRRMEGWKIPNRKQLEKDM